MSGISDTATVTLNVNGAQAKKVIQDLSDQIDQTKEKIRQMKDAGADPKAIEKVKKQLRNLQKQLAEAQSATEGVREVFDNLDKATPRQLEKALRTLNKQLKDMEPGSEVWNEHIEKIKALKERIAELREELEEQESLWDRFCGWLNNSGATLLAIFLGFDTAINTLRGYVDTYAEMEQEMANVRKFSGMTQAQVAELNEEFKKIDTRSTREQLNILAQEAGRLGKTSVEDILGFVRAADKVNVALDDLGKGATLSLSKLTNIFGVEEIYGTEDALLKTGSVINELSQNCSASAPYIAEFTSRIGGVGAQANLTIPQIMGFAAVLDANAQQVEASSTALSQIIVRLYQEPAKYAKVAGLEVESFTKLMKQDANAALILFLETLQKAGGMDTLSPMFKDMGENGSRAIAALSTLATHIDMVKAQQEAANIAFEEGSSIDIEFAVQNNTVQAALDKCKNAAHELQVELGERLYPVMKYFLTSGSAIMRGLLTSVRFLAEYKTTIITLTVTIGAYIAILKLQELWTKRVAIETALLDKNEKILAATQKALSGATAVLRLGYTMLTNTVAYFRNGLRVTYEMQERWRKSMAAMNFASWTGLILALGSAVYLLYKHFSQASEAEKMMTKIKDDAIGRMGEEKIKIEALVAAAKDETLALDERQKMIAKLNAIIPDYNAHLDETTGKYIENKEALEEYFRSLTRLYEIEGAREELKKLGSEKSKAVVARDKVKELYDKSVEYVQSGAAPTYTTSWGATRNAGFDQSASLKSELETKEYELNKIQDRIDRLYKSYGKQIVNPDEDNKPETEDKKNDNGGGTGYTSQTLLDKEKKKQEKEARAAAVKARKEFKAALDQIKGDRAEAETQAMADRSAGLIDYREYIDRMRAAEVQYYEESSKLYISSGLEEDEDHKTLLKKKQEADDKYNENRLALNKEVIERIAAVEEQEILSRYQANTQKSLADELAYKEELLTVRYNKLMDLQALYLRGSKEWEDYEYKIQDLLRSDQEEKQKAIVAKIQEYQKNFDKQSIADKYKMEYAAVEELYRLKKISEEQYQKWLEALKKKEAKELPGSRPETTSTAIGSAQKNFDRDKSELDKALAAGQITQEEYDKRLSRIKSSLDSALLEPLKQAKSEWVSMMTTMIDSWIQFADALKDPEADPLAKLSAGIESTAALMSAVMSQMSAFVQAEMQIQTAKIEARYDTEIQRAEGNSYKVAKLEKEKEEEIAKAKNDANRKMFAMQVIQAVAQTATNALNAYGSAAAVPVVGHILAPIAAGMAVAAGMIQVAAIKKQQQASEAQGYSEGGFTKPGRVDEPAGIVHAGEWVASQKLLASPVARPMIEALDYAQRTNTIGSLSPEHVSRAITAPQQLSMMADADPSAALIVSAVASNAGAVSKLLQRLDEPFVTVNTVTGDKGIQKAYDEYDTLIRNKTPRSRRK